MSWEQGYEAGNAGLLKAVETAKLLGAVQERERILTAVEKMRPYIDENGVNWFAPFNNIIKAIKGENK
jgi:hypothetical protein